MFKMLYVVSTTKGCTKEYIVHHFGGDVFSNALCSNYIAALEKNTLGEDLYFVTEIGQDFVNNGGE